MDIKEKLARLDSTSKNQVQPEQHSDDWIAAAESELDVKVIRDGNSFFLLKENYYPLFENEHDGLLEKGIISPKFNLITSEEPDKQLHWKKLIFVDLETTGLAGGTGTYAFLIGLGHIELDQIVVRQYLLPDFGHEWLMLKFVDLAIQNFEHIASFNGKSFDIPLLNNRFILNRMVPIMEDMPHVDLLHAARRIWKRRLPSCDLQTLETYILDYMRIGDIPGELIPQLYFEFIRKREAFIMADVLEHNFHDIVNLVLLSLKISAIAESPLEYLHFTQDHYSLAHYYFQNNHFEEALPLLEFILDAKDSDRELGLSAFFLLALIFKKLKKSTESKKYLWELLNRQYHHPKVIEELAKFYEHEDKDYQTAKQIVDKGLRYLETVQQLNGDSELSKYLPELKHRLKRLNRKLGRKG
jgi:uncharacterized protein YprB with RNaseH-like and TPR domain